MKNKILYMISLCFLFFVVFTPKVYAETKVKLNLDLEYHDTFNIFYEMKNATPLAQVLVEYGDNLLSFLAPYINQDLSGAYFIDNYFIRLWYAGDTSDIQNENIRNNAYYMISLTHQGHGSNSYDYAERYTRLYFDENMNYLGLIDNPTGRSIGSGTTLSLNGGDIYYFTSFYQGTYNLVSSNGDINYVLAYVIDEGHAYKVNGNYLFFNKLIEFFTNSPTMYEDLENKSFDLSWYSENSVISQNKALTYSHDTIFNLGNIDLGDEWTKINVTDYSNGFYLVPKVTEVTEGNSANLYYYTTSNDIFLKGSLVHFDELGNANTNIAYALNSNQGKMILTLINHGTFKNVDNKLAVVSSSIEGETKWYKYAFYFTASNVIDNVYLFYDADIYEIKVVDSTNYVTLTDIETGTTNRINSSTVKMNTDNYINQNDIHSGGVDTKYPSGVPMTWIDSGKSAQEYYMSNGGTSYFDSTTIFSNASSIVKNLASSISGFFAVVKACFESFPEIVSLLYFGITAVIIISIWHFVRG